MDIVRIILAGLACYRLAELISLDEGPIDIFSNLRIVSGRHASVSDNRFIVSFAKLINCPFCLGIWFAIPLCYLVFVPSVVGDVILGFFAITGIQCFLESRSGNRND
jgi:hypothetical protein